MCIRFCGNVFTKPLPFVYSPTAQQQLYMQEYLNIYDNGILTQLLEF
jgi:hypothetical protein